MLRSLCAVVSACAMGCGLGVAGEGPIPTVDAGLAQASASPMSDGAALGFELAQDGASAGDATTEARADAPPSDGATGDAVDTADSRGKDSSPPSGPVDAGATDALEDGGSVCERLAACCQKLGALGGSAPVCTQNATANDAGSCQSALVTIQLALPGLCL